jgi:RNA polymerase sigma-70 factor (ECF subfamily)
VDNRSGEVTAGPGGSVPPARAARLYDRTPAAQWGLAREAFASALERSVRHAFADRDPSASDVEQYLDKLHVEDLALAAACASGADAAWDHFVREHRPSLYRAAGAIDRNGGGRELADSLYAELFGLRERDGARQSLFRYFHGRSSLGSWVRAVLAQRHVDGLRASRRLAPLPDDDGPGALPAAPNVPNAGVSAYHVAMHAALALAIAALAPRDRLRLASYYAQNMKLAAIGRMLGEHEASVSRHLTRTRSALRAAVEAHLRSVAGYDESAVSECFRTVAGDSGVIDLDVLLGPGGSRQEAGARSFVGKGDV